MASPAMKNVRVLLEEEFGLTTRYVRGRKVDISASIYLNFTLVQGISVYEFKSIIHPNRANERTRKGNYRGWTMMAEELNASSFGPMLDPTRESKKIKTKNVTVQAKSVAKKDNNKENLHPLVICKNVSKLEQAYNHLALAHKNKK